MCRSAALHGKESMAHFIILKQTHWLMLGPLLVRGLGLLQDEWRGRQPPPHKKPFCWWLENREQPLQISHACANICIVVDSVNRAAKLARTLMCCSMFCRLVLTPGRAGSEQHCFALMVPAFAVLLPGPLPVSGHSQYLCLQLINHSWSRSSKQQTYHLLGVPFQ